MADTKLYVNASWTDAESFITWYTTEMQEKYPGLVFEENAFGQMADAVATVKSSENLPADIIALGNGNVGTKETVSGEGTEFTVAGTYNISGTEWTNLGYLQLNPSKETSETRYVLNVADSNLVMTKPQLRGSSDLNITDSHVDFAVQSGASSGYLFAFKDSAVTIKNSVVGYDSNQGNSSEVVAGEEFSVGTNGEMKTCVYGTFTAENSTIFTFGGDTKNNAFAIYDKGLGSFTDSVLYANHITIGDYENRTDRDTVGRDGEIATITLNKSKIIDNPGEAHGMVIGDDKDGQLIMTNGSLVDYSNAAVTVNTNGTIEISGSTLKAKSITNSGTVKVSGTSKLNAGTYAGDLTLGSTEAATTLTTDGLTFDNSSAGRTLYITDGSTVTLSGNGFNFDEQSNYGVNIRNSAAERSGGAHIGHTLNFDNVTLTTDNQTFHSIYTNSGSVVNFSKSTIATQGYDTYLNTYGGTVNVKDASKIGIGYTRTTGTVNVTGEDTELNTYYVSLFKAPEGYHAGILNLTDGAKMSVEYDIAVNATAKDVENYAIGGSADASLNISNATLKANSIDNTKGGSVTVTGTSKLSTNAYTGDLNIGSTEAETALITDGFKQTSGNIIIADGSTVTLSGSGFDFNDSTLFYDSASKYNENDHTGYTLNFTNYTNTTGKRANAIYANGKSTVNFSGAMMKNSSNSTYLNLYGGTVTVKDASDVDYCYACVTGELDITGKDTKFYATQMYIYNGYNETYTGGVVNVSDGATLAFRDYTSGTTRDEKYYYVKGGSTTGTLNVNNATVNINGGATNNININLTVAASTDSALVNVGGAFTNSGTITVDMTAGEKVAYKLIDASSASDYGTYDFATGKDNGYTLSVSNNDLFAINTDKADYTSLAVNAAWASTMGYGDEIVVGEGEAAKSYYYGITAFSSATDLQSAITTDTATIVAFGGETALGDLAVSQNLTIETAETTSNAATFSSITVAKDIALTIAAGSNLNGGTITNAGSVNLSGTTKFSGTLAGGTYNFADGTVLTTDGLSGSSNMKWNIVSGSDVLMSGSGFNFAKMDVVIDGESKLTVKDFPAPEESTTVTGKAWYVTGGSELVFDNSFTGKMSNANVGADSKLTVTNGSTLWMNNTLYSYGETNVGSGTTLKGAYMNIYTDHTEGNASGKIVVDGGTLDTGRMRIGYELTGSSYAGQGDNKVATLELKNGATMTLTNTNSQRAIKVGTDEIEGKLVLNDTSTLTNTCNTDVRADNPSKGWSGTGRYILEVGKLGEVTLNGSSVIDWKEAISNAGTITLNGTSQLLHKSNHANATAIVNTGTITLSDSAKISSSKDIENEGGTVIFKGEGTAATSNATVDGQIFNGTIVYDNFVTSIDFSYVCEAISLKNGSKITSPSGQSSLNISVDNTSALIMGSGFTVEEDHTLALGYSADHAMITVTGAFSNTGTITIDMTGANDDGYLLIEGNADSTYGTSGTNYKFKDGTGTGYTLTVVDGDLYAFKDEPTPGKDYVVSSDWAGYTEGTEIKITKDDGVTYTYTFGETAFSNVTGDGGVLTKIKPGKIITLYSNLSETGNFEINKAYQINLNGHNYETTGTVSDSITIRNSTDTANTFTGGTLNTADYGYFSVNGINTAVFDTVKNAGGTVFLYTTALLKTNEWINEEKGAKRGGRGEVYVCCPNEDEETKKPVLTESYYKIIDYTGEDSEKPTSITNYGWVGDDDGITPAKGNYLWFYSKNHWEEALPEGYKWATEDGDLVIIKYGEDAPVKLGETSTATKVTVDSGANKTSYYSQSIEATELQDVVITANENSTEMKITGDVSSENGNVTITDKGELLHITRDVTSAETTTITTDGDAANVEIGGKVSGRNVVIENTKDSGNSKVSATNGFVATDHLEIRNEASETEMTITGDVISTTRKTTITTDGDAANVKIDGKVSSERVVIENTKESGSTAVSATNGFEATELLEIRNETSNTLSASGKLNVNNIMIYNNDETARTKAGTIEITDTIEAAGTISITNGSVSDEQTGTVNLGTQVHTAASGLRITNETGNVINGGVVEEVEQAANITVTDGYVDIENDGHINLNLSAENSEVEIRNTSKDTLITTMTGDTVTVSNSGAIKDSTITADSVTISRNGTISNTQINAEALTFSRAYQVVTFDWSAETKLNFTFTGGFTVESGTVFIDASGFTGDSADSAYLLIDNQSLTEEDYSNVVTSDGYTLKLGKEIGKTGDGAYDLYLVKEKPVIYTVEDNVYDDGTNKWIGKSAATVKVTVVSPSHTEITSNTYAIDGAAAVEAESNPYTLTLVTGTAGTSHTYAFNATDKDGSAANEVVLNYTYDGVAPTIAVDDLTGGYDGGSTYWYRQGVDARISAKVVDYADEAHTITGSGVKSVNLNGVITTTIASNRVETLYETTAEGTTYKFEAVDNVGNETSATKQIGVDGTGPAIGDAVLAGSQILGNVSGEWIKAGTEATVTTEITDKLSGLKSAALDNSGSAIDYKDGKFTITTTKGQDTDVTEHLITAVDNVGNVSYKAVAYGIDGTGPEASAYILSGTNVYGSWVKAESQFAVKMSFTDAKSGFNDANLDGVEYQNGQFSVTAEKESETCEHKVTAADKVGNQATTYVSYSVDGTGPQIGEVKITGSNVYQGTWVKAGSAFAVETVITDAKSGLAGATLAGSDYDAEEKKFTLLAGDEDGQVTQTIKATDNVGNESKKDVTYLVDGTGPSISIVSNPTQDVLCTSVTVTATFADNGSGLASAQYSFNGIDWTGALAGNTITVAGINENKTVYFRAFDNVGNESTDAFVVGNIVKEANPYVIDGVTRTIESDLTCTDFSVINGGVLDGKETKTLTADTLYLSSGTVKNVDVVVDNIVAQGGENDISEIDLLRVSSAVTVESGTLTVSKDQYDAMFDHVDLTVDGALVVTGAGTISQAEVERLLTSKSIRDITFAGAELNQINKLTFTGFTQLDETDAQFKVSGADVYITQNISSATVKVSSMAQRLTFGNLTGTDRNDKLTIEKNASIVLSATTTDPETKGIDLGEGSNTITVKSNAQLVLDTALANVTTFSVNSGSVYKVNRSSYQEYTEVTAGDISFSSDRADSFSIGNYTAVKTDAVTGGEKNDKLTVGKDSTFSAASITAVETISFGSYTDAEIATYDKYGTKLTDGDISGVNKLTVSSGKAATSSAEAVLTTLTANNVKSFVEESGEKKDPAKNDTISAGNYVVMDVKEIDLGEGTADKLSVGKYSSFKAASIANVETVSLGSYTDAEVAGDISGINKLTVSNGKAGDTTALTAGAVSGLADKNDTVSIGNYADVKLGAVDLQNGDKSKSDKLSVGKYSSFKAASIANVETVSFGNYTDAEVGTYDEQGKFTAGDISGVKTLTLSNGKDGYMTELTAGAISGTTGTSDKVSVGSYGEFTAASISDVETVSFGSYTDAEVTGDISNVNKLTLSNGKAATSKAEAVYSKLDVAGGITGTGKSDKLSIGNYADVNIHELIDFGGTAGKSNKDQLTVGKNSTVVLKATEDGADSLTKFTIGKDSTAYLSSELIAQGKKLSTSFAKDATVYDIGSAKDGVAQAFTDLDTERADNDFDHARTLAALTGWLDGEKDTAEVALDDVDCFKADAKITGVTVYSEADIEVWVGTEKKTLGVAFDVDATDKVKITTTAGKAGKYTITLA